MTGPGRPRQTIAHRAAGLLAAGTMAAGMQALAEVPVLHTPVMQTAPAVDGRIDPAEWSSAHGFDGFVVNRKTELEQRRARAWIGATADTIYVAIASQLPDEGTLKAAISLSLTVMGTLTDNRIPFGAL